MALKLYYHPFSSFSQKALIAFHEKNLPFTPSIVDFLNPTAKAEYAKVNPLGRLPFLLVEEKDHRLPESSIIIEYIDAHYSSGTKLIPSATDLARQTRFYDRLCDLYLNEPMQTCFIDGRRPLAEQSPYQVARAHATLDRVLPLFEKTLENKTWLLGEAFTMADCAAAPALGYLRMIPSIRGAQAGDRVLQPPLGATIRRARLQGGGALHRHGARSPNAARMNRVLTGTPALRPAWR